MAKKELNFNKLGLPPKANIIKKDDAATPNIEKAIEKIHGETVKVAPVAEPKPEPIVVATPTPVVEEVIVPTPVAVAPKADKPTASKAVAVEIEEMMPVKKISMDLPLDVYKYLKINSFDQAVTMKDYVLKLIEADMKKKNSAR
jgi:hypothetical protein